MSDTADSDSERTREANAASLAPSSDRPQARAPAAAKPVAVPRRATAPGRRKSAPASRGRLRAGILYVVLALVSLTLTGGTFLIVANPADLLRDRLAAQVQLRTGHDLAVNGGTSLTLFPSLGVTMREVTLSASRDASATPVLSANAVTARLAWWPLMQGRIAVRHVAMRQPVIDLAVDADGRFNWDFASIADGLPNAPVRVAQLAPRFQHGQGLPPDLYEALERSSKARGKSLIGRVMLRHVSVSEATVRYSDARTGATREIAGIDLDLELNDTGALISGSGVWGGERVALDGAAEHGSAHAAKLVLRAKAKPLEATWDGTVALASGSPELDGQITVRAASAATLAKWIGNSSSGDSWNGPASVEGRLQVSGGRIDLKDARVALDDVTATGFVAIETMRKRPLIRADLEIAALDLDRHFAPDNQHGTQGASESPSQSTGSISDLLRRTEDEGLPPHPSDKAQVRGFTKRVQAWSTQPIAVRVPRDVDLTGKLAIGKLAWRHIALGPSRANVSLKAGVLRIEADGANVYGGHGKAVLSVREENAAAIVDLTASVDNAAALPLMRDAADFDWVEGRGDLTLAVTTQGTSEREMAERLNGRAVFKVADGAVIGWDVTHMLRRLRQGHLTALDRDPAHKTPFSELSGSFSIGNGTATNQDLKMTGPAIEVAGAGTVALPQRTVDYTVKPRLIVGAAAPSNGTAEPLGIEVPVRIHGAWAQPQFSVDLQSALADPRTADTIQKIGRQLRSGNVGEAVKGILGDGPEAEEKAAKAKKFLQQFLKQ